MFTVTDFPHLPGALCKDADADELTPELDDHPKLAQLQREQAVSHCAGCPELVRCMAWAESEDYPYGAWGGRWWDGAPTDVAVDDAPVPRRPLRTVSREHVA